MPNLRPHEVRMTPNPLPTVHSGRSQPYRWTSSGRCRWTRGRRQRSGRPGHLSSPGASGVHALAQTPPLRPGASGVDQPRPLRDVRRVLFGSALLADPPVRGPSSQPPLRGAREPAVSLRPAPLAGTGASTRRDDRRDADIRLLGTARGSLGLGSDSHTGRVAAETLVRWPAHRAPRPNQETVA